MESVLYRNPTEFRKYKTMKHSEIKLTSLQCILRSKICLWASEKQLFETFYCLSV